MQHIELSHGSLTISHPKPMQVILPQLWLHEIPDGVNMFWESIQNPKGSQTSSTFAAETPWFVVGKSRGKSPGFPIFPSKSHGHAWQRWFLIAAGRRSTAVWPLSARAKPTSAMSTTLRRNVEVCWVLWDACRSDLTPRNCLVNSIIDSNV